MTIFAVLAAFWFLFVMTLVGLNLARVARRSGARRRHGSPGPYGSTWDSSTSSYDHGSWSSADGGSSWGVSDGGSSWGSSDCGSSWSSSDGGSSSSSDSGSSCS